MIRLFLAAMLLTVIAAPTFACDWGRVNAEADSQSSTVASQPAQDQSVPQSTTDAHAPS